MIAATNVTAMVNISASVDSPVKRPGTESTIQARQLRRARQRNARRANRAITQLSVSFCAVRRRRLAPIARRMPISF
jgi:hypothetical protein